MTTLLAFMRENRPWLAAGFLLTLLSGFGQTFFISIFAGHVRESFSLSHGEWGGIYTLATAASAVAMVWAGGLTDTHRVRTLAPVVLTGLALACLAMALNPVWWGLLPVIFALRLTGQGMCGHMSTVAMSRWFAANRGKALSIATLGFSAGEAVLPIVFVALMALVDWRLLWIAAAILAVAGTPPLLALLRHERSPRSAAESTGSVGMLGRSWSRRQALSHWLFWLMVPAMLGPPAFITAFFFHQVHFVEIKGISHVELVALYPLYTLAGIGAMLASGAAVDGLSTPRLIPFIQIPAIIGFLLFAHASGIAGLLAGLLFLGLTAGLCMTVPNAFWAEFYGTGSIGSIKAVVAAIAVLGSAAGPGLTGLGIDLGLDLEAQYVLVAAYFGLVTLIMAVGVARARALLP